MNTQDQALVRPWEGLATTTAEVLRPSFPDLTEEIIGAIQVEVPAYRRPLEGSFGVGVRRGVEEALREFVALIEDPGVDRSQGREVCIGLGRGEWREGRSLDALLSAYRTGARVAWRRVSEAARAAELDSDELSLLAESIFAYIDELSAFTAEGYALAQSEAAGETDRRRQRLVQLIVAEPPRDERALAEAAHALDLTLPRGVAVLVWRGGLARITPRLPPGVVAATIDDDISCALLPDPEAPRLRADLATATRNRPAGLGPAVDLADAHHSFARARSALELARAEGGLVAAEERLADIVVGANPAALEELAASALAPLAGETPASRARLTETLRTWLDEQGSVSAVADSLHVHPQTVRYRLGRLRECFGDGLDDAETRFALSLALRADEGAAHPRD